MTHAGGSPSYAGTGPGSTRVRFSLSLQARSERVHQVRLEWEGNVPYDVAAARLHRYISAEYGRDVEVRIVMTGRDAGTIRILKAGTTGKGVMFHEPAPK